VCRLPAREDACHKPAMIAELLAVFSRRAIEFVCERTLSFSRVMLEIGLQRRGLGFIKRQALFQGQRCEGVWLLVLSWAIWSVIFCIGLNWFSSDECDDLADLAVSARLTYASIKKKNYFCECS